jgi:hypothetical protein
MPTVRPWIGVSFSVGNAVVTLYFCWDDNAPVMRYWPFVPRVGDTIVLPELGGILNTLKVVDVVCEGFDEPSISVYLHPVRREPNGGEFLAASDNEAAR